MKRKSNYKPIPKKLIPKRNPCVCGSRHTQVVRQFGTWYYVECLECYRRTDFHRSEQEAVNIWNGEI